jgi:hypothetical protein
MTSYAQSKEQVYWLGSTSQHQSDWYPWPIRPVRSSQHTQLGGTDQTGAPDRQSGQVLLRSCQSRKKKGVRAIWARVIRMGLQAGLDHFAPFSQHKQCIIQNMHHNLAIKSFKYYNKVQTHSSTHINVLKSTKIKF